MLTNQGKIVLGLTLIVGTLSLVDYGEYAFLIGGVLLVSAIGMVQKGFIGWKDLGRIFSMDGIVSFIGFFGAILFGLRFLAFHLQFMLPYISWLQIGWAIPVGLLLLGIGVLKFASGKKR